MTTHAMIDIETLATSPEAVILSVGGVKFDPYTNEEPHSFIDMKLDIDEQTALHEQFEDKDYFSDVSLVMRDVVHAISRVMKRSVSCDEVLKDSLCLFPSLR